MIESEKKHGGRIICRRVISAFFERAAVNFVDDLRGLGELSPTSVTSKVILLCIACELHISVIHPDPLTAALDVISQSRTVRIIDKAGTVTARLDGIIIDIIGHDIMIS